MQYLVDVAYALFWLGMAATCFAVAAAIRRGAPSRQAPKSSNFVHTSDKTTFTLHESFATLNARRVRTRGAEVVTETTEGTQAEAEAIGRGNCWAWLRFHGDIKATGKDAFALLVTEVIMNKEKFKGVIVQLNSPGGGVAEYGQLYAEMLRLKNAGIEIHTTTDTYLCSGGYLMALPSTRIIASELAYVGSVGVVTEFPNFYHAAKKIGITPITATAGTRKRTITQLSNPDDEEKMAAFQEKLDHIFEQFKSLVHQHRPAIDVQHLNGDSWSARYTVDHEMHFVDEIATSAEYIARIRATNDIVELGFKKGPFEGGLLKLITKGVESGMSQGVDRLLTRMLEDSH